MAKDKKKADKAESNKTQVARPAAPVPDFDFGAVKVVRSLVSAVLKISEGESVYVRIDEAMSLSKMPQKENADGKGKREPATICPVTNLVDKKSYTLICAAMIKRTLNERYDNDSYVGKMFKITKLDKVAVQGGGGKTVNRFEIDEISI